MLLYMPSPVVCQHTSSHRAVKKSESCVVEKLVIHTKVTTISYVRVRAKTLIV